MRRFFRHRVYVYREDARIDARSKKLDQKSSCQLRQGQTLITAV